MKIIFEENKRGLDVYVLKSEHSTLIGLPISSISELKEFSDKIIKYLDNKKR